MIGSRNTITSISLVFNKVKLVRLIWDDNFLSFILLIWSFSFFTFQNGKFVTWIKLTFTANKWFSCEQFIRHSFIVMGSAVFTFLSLTQPKKWFFVNYSILIGFFESIKYLFFSNHISALSHFPFGMYVPSIFQTSTPHDQALNLSKPFYYLCKIVQHPSSSSWG